jgi:hypothetical protein
MDPLERKFKFLTDGGRVMPDNDISDDDDFSEDD